MDHIKRKYVQIIKNHLDVNEKIVFLVGPRQVGKTTIATELLNIYGGGRNLNWDKTESKELILKDPDAIMKSLNLVKLGNEKPLIIFDEIHKMPNWQS